MGALRREGLGRLPRECAVYLPPEKDEYDKVTGKQTDWPHGMWPHGTLSFVPMICFESNDPVVYLFLSLFYRQQEIRFK